MVGVLRWNFEGLLYGGICMRFSSRQRVLSSLASRCRLTFSKLDGPSCRAARPRTRVVGGSRVENSCMVVLQHLVSGTLSIFRPCFRRGSVCEHRHRWGVYVICTHGLGVSFRSYHKLLARLVFRNSYALRYSVRLYGSSVERSRGSCKELQLLVRGDVPLVGWHVRGSP